MQTAETNKGGDAPRRNDGKEPGNIHCMVPWSLIEFHPVVDLDWARDNGIEVVSYLESIINAEDERCKSDKAIKEFRRNYDNTDAYLEANGKRIKIKGFIGRFRPSYTLVDRLEINPEVIGVIEYILQKQKTMVMRQDGNVMVKTLPIK